MNIVIFKRGCKIWVVRDILLLWVNLVERIIHYVLEKMDKNVYIPVENTKEIYCLNEISHKY